MPVRSVPSGREIEIKVLAADHSVVVSQSWLDVLVFSGGGIALLVLAVGAGPCGDCRTSSARSRGSSLERVESSGELDHWSMFGLGQITVENHPLSRPLSPGCGIKYLLNVSDAVQ
jgi:hypothetical protein